MNHAGITFDKTFNAIVMFEQVINIIKIIHYLQQKKFYTNNKFEI